MRMNKSNVKLLSDGTVIDSNMMDVSKVTHIKIPREVISVLNEFNKDITEFNIGTYINDNPIVDAHGSNVIDVKTLIIDRGETLYAGKLAINKLNYKLLKRNIQTTSSNTTLLKLMSEYIQSHIMIIDHFEYDVVLKDKMGISNKVCLNENIVNEYPSFIDYLISLYPETKQVLYTRINEAYELLYKMVTSTLQMDALFNSVSIKIDNSMLVVMEFESPSSRRYYINSELVDKT